MEVRGPRNRVLGHALFSAESQITLRMIARDDRPITRDFWRDRLATAIRFREQLAIDATAYRLVHGEADLLPSLIVDRYADWLVLQTLSQGTDRLLPVVVQALTDLLQPKGILARDDPPGLFLDQRENHAAARAYARGRLLDCFSYHGGFSLALRPACDHALALDISEDAIA